MGCPGFSSCCFTEIDVPIDLRWEVLGVTLGSLYVDAQEYVPALLENLHGMSCSGTYWLLGGGWFQCRY